MLFLPNGVEDYVIVCSLRPRSASGRYCDFAVVRYDFATVPFDVDVFSAECEEEDLVAYFRREAKERRLFGVTDCAIGRVSTEMLLARVHLYSHRLLGVAPQSSHGYRPACAGRT